MFVNVESFFGMVTVGRRGGGLISLNRILQERIQDARHVRASCHNLMVRMLIMLNRIHGQSHDQILVRVGLSTGTTI